MHDPQKTPSSLGSHPAFLIGILALLCALVVPLGVAIARSGEPPFGRWSYPLFVVLNLAIAGLGGWLLFDAGRRLKRRGRLLRGIVFVVYLLVVVVVGLDLVLEFFPRLIPPKVLATLPFGGNYLYPRGTATHEYRRDLGFKPRPHVRVEFFYTHDLVRYGQVSPFVEIRKSHIAYSTDAQGFRNRDEATTADVVVLGDSFTELPYIDYDEVWPNVLAARTGLRIRNLAVSGHAPTQQLVVLRTWGRAYKPRLVIFAFYEGNDILECEAFEDFRLSGLNYPVWLVRRYAGRMGWFERRPVVAILRMLLLPYKRIGEAWGRDRARRRSQFNPIEFEAGGHRLKIGLLSTNLNILKDDAAAVRSQAGWPLCRRALEAMKETCDEAGATFLVVYIPTKERVYLPLLRDRLAAEDVYDFAAGYHEELAGMSPEEFVTALFDNMDATEAAVRELCGERAIPFLSLTEPFRQAARGGRMIFFPYDTHWNAEGNRIAADEIERFLRKSMPK